ncbi:MAG: hypothetical protein EOP56_07175 [Sphingobacteriales bacterium]|nr:MAG: hypothetical protein EOP56_07175 [Sphingobacteriales bacterium]
MRNILLALSALLLLIHTTSCGKKNKLKGPYTFENNTGETINLRMYKTLDDYANSTSPALAVRMAPGDAYKWDYTDADEMLQQDKTFYMDWYTDDYKMTNWTWFRSISQVSLLKPPYSQFTRQRYGSKIHVITPDFHSGMRSVLIKGNMKELTWTAVGAVNLRTFKSVWDTLSMDSKYCELVIRKDLTANVNLNNSTINLAEIPFYGDSNDEQFVSLSQINGRSAILTPYRKKWLNAQPADTLLLEIGNLGYLLLPKP